MPQITSAGWNTMLSDHLASLDLSLTDLLVRPVSLEALSGHVSIADLTLGSIAYPTFPNFCANRATAAQSMSRCPTECRTHTPGTFRQQRQGPKSQTRTTWQGRGKRVGGYAGMPPAQQRVHSFHLRRRKLQQYANYNDHDAGRGRLKPGGKTWRALMLTRALAIYRLTALVVSSSPSFGWKIEGNVPSMTRGIPGTSSSASAQGTHSSTDDDDDLVYTP